MLLVLIASCGGAPNPASEAEFRPTATVKDIMDSMVDPSADFVWASVATVVDADGEHEKFPQTDEEWKDVRRRVITILEATNLLLVPGRHIAKPGEKAEDPKIELAPEAIEALVNQDRPSWIRLAHGLHDAASEALAAADARSTESIMTAGEKLDRACENCHQKYWYPPNENTVVTPAIPLSAAAPPDFAANSGPAGTIKGIVRLDGKAPGNIVIRMGVDPACSRSNDGKQVTQDVVVTGANGGLANAFIKLQGNFPASPVPAEPVVVDQRGCIYRPRVIGARAGQTLLIRNGDGFLHNVHSLSGVNSFNAGQAGTGAVNSFQLKSEDAMLQLKCDLHRWMTAYVGVVNHPYFAVSGDGGAFTIDKVPAGTHTIQAWHEKYGVITQTVRVTAGAMSTVDFSYPSK